MPSAVIDVCCLIDLLASGYAEAVLRAAGFDWHLPAAVQGEVQFVRQHDPEQPGHTIQVPADLTPLIASAVLCVAQFSPNPSMPEYQWWIDRLGNAGS